jgi:hypothetical protein
MQLKGTTMTTTNQSLCLHYFSGNEDPLQEHENEDETRSIPQDDASFHGTNDDST